MNNSELKFDRLDVYDRRHKNILLVEDNEGDVEIFKENCEENRYPCTLFSVWNGEEAMKFLNYHDTKPDIIILDINMPIMDGHETLKKIKSDENFHNIPVVILTSSKLSLDVEQAKENGAIGFIVKPAVFNISELLGFIDVSKSQPDTFLDFSKNKNL